MKAHYRVALTVLAGVVIVLPFAAHAQRTEKMPVIGVLWHAANAEEEAPFRGPLREGFTNLGYVEGKNIIFEERYPDEQPERFHSLVADLVRLKVDVLVAVSNLSALAAQRATSTIPIVFCPCPVRFLDTLNRTLYQNVQRMRSDKNLTLALLTYAQGQVRISGQHEEALIVRRGGGIERIATIDLGFPLGLEADIAKFVRHISVALQPGDGVVLYTDGITEAADMHHRLYGIERLCTVISQHWAGSAHDIQAAVLADVRGHIGAQKVYDDITLVVAKQR